MSTAYTGVRSIQSTVTVASTASTITTTSPHGLAINDAIHVFGAAEVQVDGPWIVASVTGSTTFTIANSGFVNGSGGAAGSVTVYRASITQPSDGDALAVASVNPGLEGLADQIADLYGTQGKYYLVDIGQTRSIATPSVTSSLAAIQNLGTPASFNTANANDVVETLISVTTVTNTTGAGTAAVEMWLYENLAGAGFAPNTYTEQLASPRTSGSDSIFNSFTLVGYTLIATPGTYTAQLWGRSTVTGTTATNLTKLSSTQKLWRRR